jgi:hypothetical protein
MQNPSEPVTPRREFLGQLAASAIVLAGTACATPATGAQTTPSPAAASEGAARPPKPDEPTHWDDSWSGRLVAKHKAVFDMPEVNDGEAIYHAGMWIGGTREALAPAPGDIQAVIVIRHAAVVLAFSDAIWAKYELGKERKVKDDATGKWAVRNPYAAPAPRSSNDSSTKASGADEPGSDLAWFARNGHVLLACDVATRGMSYILAKKVKGEQSAIYQELKVNLLPGVILQPSGIYAVHRAQEAGCTYSA